MNTALNWVKANLFSSVWNSILTLVTLAVVVVSAKNLWVWTTQVARWDVIPANFRLLMVGPYPQDELWRVWVWVSAIAFVAALSLPRLGNVALVRLSATLVAIYLGVMLLQSGSPSGFWVPLICVAFLLGIFISMMWRISPIVMVLLALLVFAGGIYMLGADFGRGNIPTGRWGGLLLTFILSLVSIVLSFPFGVLLAVGRTSKMPIVAAVSTFYIEIIRGIPLVVVLFIAQLFVPLFLPGLVTDDALKIVVGLTLFTAAYIAEYVRGGLQAVPSGQAEAGRALGFNGTQTLWNFVLPQALRSVIPGIAGQFITLFKDTSLVAVVGLTDLLKIGSSITANPDWIGRFREVYIVIAIIYFVFSYGMSFASRALEKSLGVGQR